jgi:putative ABC transport system permease protein
MMIKFLLILKISWRSIWRNKRRTFISLFSILIATCIPTFFVCIAWGFYAGLVDDVARLMAGHVTYEHVEYRNSPSNDLWVDDIQTINSILNDKDEVISTKQIVNLQGVAHTAKGSVGVSLMGIEPSKEITISFLPESIVAGEYLSQGDGRWVIVGSKLSKLEKNLFLQQMILTVKWLKICFVSKVSLKRDQSRLMVILCKVISVLLERSRV